MHQPSPPSSRRKAFADTALTAFAALALGAVFITTAAAQTTYTWTSAVTNDLWNDASHWDQPQPPGSALNGSGGTTTDDIVIIRNAAPSGNRNIRLESDAGTIGSLEIGGSTTGGANANFQLRLDPSNLDVTGDVTLGSTVNSGQKVGQLTMNNGNSTMTIGGDIVSGSTAGGNRINVDGGATANINLTGTIDPGGAKEIDLYINRSGGFTTQAGITMNVDGFRVGFGANVNRTGRSYTLDGNRTINGNLFEIGYAEGNNAGDRNVDGTLTINSATLTVSGAGYIGRSGGTSADERNGEGTINVGADGVLSTGGTLNIANMNDSVVNVDTTTKGTLNLTAANSDVNVGGGMNIGSNGRGEGIVTMSGGTLDTTGTILIAGDETGGDDSGSMGTFTVTGGTVTSGGTTSVGQGGTGFLTVDNATYNITAGNLVVGQTFAGPATSQEATGTVVFSNGAQVNIGTSGTNRNLNFNQGGGSVTQSGAATVVNVNQSVQMNDEGTSGGGTFSSTYTLNDGILNVEAVNGGGDLNMATANGSNANLNVNGGTLNVSDILQVGGNNNIADRPDAAQAILTITAGTVNVGVNAGSGSAGGNQDLNLANGDNGTTGTVNISGGSLNVGINVDYRGGTGEDNFNVSGSAIVAIGNDLDMNGGGIANQNKLKLTGSNATFTVDRDVLLDNNAELTFELDAGGASKIDAVRNLTLTNADLIVDFSGSTLTSANTLGDIDLINFDGTITGVFSTFAFNDTVQAFGDGTEYVLQNGTSDNGTTGIYLEAVPEPSSVLLLALSGLTLLRRRR